MKSTTFFALFLLSASTSYLPSSVTGFVLDTDGNPLRNGGVYYIFPVIIQNGGGIEFAATGNETCPTTVVQSPSHANKGLPIFISSPHRVVHISEGLILNIGFTFVPPCAPTPSEWTIVKGLPEGLAVKLTGYDNTVPGWFKIERVPVEIGGYNLLFCPLDDSPCGYVGVHFDKNGNRRLVVSQSEDNRLWVLFQKLSYASSTSTLSTA